MGVCYQGVLFGVKLETTFAFEPEMKMENGWSKIQNEKKEVHIHISVLGCMNGRYSSIFIMEPTEGFTTEKYFVQHQTQPK
jgi:hypothetical protein